MEKENWDCRKRAHHFTGGHWSGGYFMTITERVGNLERGCIKDGRERLLPWDAGKYGTTGSM